MTALVAKRYAKAMFDIAKEKNNVREVEEQLQLVVDSLHQNEDLYTILNHPKINSEAKKKMLSDIFSKSIYEEVLDFLFILLEKGRQNLVPQILVEYIALSDEENNVVRATVYSAVALDNVQIDLIKVKLSSMFNKSIIINNKIDVSLIGGVYIKAADKVIDGSVKGKLKELQKAMLA